MSSSLAPADILVAVHGSALGAHPGAEVSGVVTDTGAAAAHLRGRPVLVPRLLPCGECSLCQRGRVAVCPGLRRHGPPAAEVVVPARFVVPLGPPLFPAEVPADRLWRFAALADTLGAPHAGLLRAGQSPGELCVILGGGVRAAGAALVVRAIGCQAVVICANAEQRAGLLEPPFQVAAVLDSAALDPDGARAAVREAAQSLGLRPHGLTLLETSGSDAGRARALAMVESGGIAVLLDRAAAGPVGPQTEMPSPLPAGPALGIAALDRICDQQGAVLGAGAAHPDLLPELVALALRAELPLDAFTDPVEPTDQAQAEVLAARRAGQAGAAALRLPIVRFRS